MPKPGLIRTIRNLIQELGAFGRPELERLRQEAEEMRREIEAIKAAKARLRAHEEAIILTQLRETVSKIQKADHVVQEHKQAVNEVVDQVGKHAAQIEEAMLQQKALKSTEDLFNRFDVGKYIMEGVPLEECLRREQSGHVQSSEQQQKHAESQSKPD